jgi:carbamoyltransferase
MTQFLGFVNYGDEYKMMGLAPYGKPSYLEQMRSIVKLQKEGGFSLDLDYFMHQSEGVSMVWESGAPKIGRVFSPALQDLLGPLRSGGLPIEQRHKDLAASAQAMYEEAFFHLLNHVQKTTGKTALCLAGGCALNSVANGKIFKRTDFKDFYAQPAAGDAGGAIGAAYYVWNQQLKKPRSFVMDHAYWGPGFDDEAVESVLRAHRVRMDEFGCTVKKFDDEGRLCGLIAAAIASGSVIGWQQGRMEWGPRALGNRSILADPRRADMKDIINSKIKRRESFRPFAPSILREAVKVWFETDYENPFMLQVFQVRPDKRDAIPAVTHVDGSGRLQSVEKSANPRYHRLISAFAAITGVPLVLNTSFNENEPVVCDPAEAIECFLRTEMDMLVIGNHLIERRGT